MTLRMPGVQEAAPNIVSLQAPTAETFQQTDGLQMLGQTAGNMSAAANRLRAIGEQGARNARASMVKEAQVRANQEIQRILEDKDNGYLVKQGAAARDSYTGVEQDLNAAFRKLADGMEDGEARKMFELAASVDFQRARTMAGLHWSKQSQVANAAQSKVLYSQHASAVAAGDWDARKDLESELGEYARIVKMTAEQRDELLSSVMSKSVATYVDTLMTEGDLSEAERILGARGQHIERALRAKLDKRLVDLKKATKEAGKLDKARNEGLTRAFAALDKGAKKSAGQAQADALADIEKQYREDKIDALTYRESRAAVLSESQDRFAVEKQELGKNLAQATVFFADNPTATAASFASQFPQQSAQLLSTATGREAFQRMTSKAGKARAGQTFRGIMLTHENGGPKGREALRQRLKTVGDVGVLTAGMTDTQAGEVMDIFREIHNLDPKDSGRATLKELATGVLKPMAYAHDGGEIKEPVNIVFRDRLIAMVNASGATTRDEQIKVMDSIMLDTVFSTDDGQPVPREFLRWKNLGLDPQTITGTTKFGDFHPSDIDEQVRKELLGIAIKLYGRGSPKENARKAEELWMKFDKPTSVEAARKAANTFKKNDEIEDIAASMPLEYLQTVVHPVAGRLFAAGDPTEFQIVEAAKEAAALIEGGGDAFELARIMRRDIELLKQAKTRAVRDDFYNYAPR